MSRPRALHDDELLDRTKAAGLLPASVETPLAAEGLFGEVLALRVMAKLDHDPVRLRRLIASALAPLGLSLPADF